MKRPLGFFLLLSAAPAFADKDSPACPIEPFLEVVESAVIDPDLALVLRAQGGDQAAFNELVTKHRSTLIGYAWTLFKDMGQAEDIVQDAFARAWRYLPTFEGRSKFSTWMHTMVRNLSLNKLKSPKGRLTAGGAEFEDWMLRDVSAAADTLPSTGARADDLISRQERLKLVGDRIKDAMSYLSPDLRQAFQLMSVQGMERNKAAKVMGCPEGTARSRLFYAHKKLREVLGADFAETAGAP